ALQAFKIFLQKPRHILELRNVGGVTIHEKLMRLEAGAGNLLLVRLPRFDGRIKGAKAIASGSGASRHGEKLRDPEILQKIGNARIRVQQFDAGRTTSV